LADRIRGNQGAYGIYGNYTSSQPVQSAGSYVNNECSMTPDETNQDRLDADCGPNKVAQEDLKEIVNDVNNLLPAGNLEVKCDNYTSNCPDNSIFHITISWKGQFASDAASQAARDAEELNEIVMSFNPGTL